MTVTNDVATDPGAFAATVLGRPMWDHQLSVLRSPARYKCVLAGRQVGKSTLLSVAALHEAATRRNVLVLLVSAGETASRRLLADCARLATGSPLINGLLDESKSELRLSNGSTILSVPASEKAIRGWPVDLLIVDEAAFISKDIWESAEPAIISRPGSKVILASSPWGTPEHYFRALWEQGHKAPDEHVASWHWPSSVNPLVDTALLEKIRERDPIYYAREFDAEFGDAEGAYFAEAELMAATAPYVMTAPEDLPTLPEDEPGFIVSGGVDWGLRVDASALALVGLIGHPLDGRARLFVPWIESAQKPYSDFIDRVITVGQGYHLRVVASERNSVGEFPTTELAKRCWSDGLHSTYVRPIWTDNKRKTSGYGRIRGLMASGQLILPLHPPLLRELRALRYEQLPGGSLRIAAEGSGHDDLAMSLLQSVSCWDTSMVRDSEAPLGLDESREVVTSGRGLPIPRQPYPNRDQISPIRVPRGLDPGDGW